MIIQIIMVGLIIAFPKLVTGGLGKEPTVDVDKAFQQMQMAPQGEGRAEPRRRSQRPEARRAAPAARRPGPLERG